MRILHVVGLNSPKISNILVASLCPLRKRPGTSVDDDRPAAIGSNGLPGFRGVSCFSCWFLEIRRGETRTPTRKDRESGRGSKVKGCSFHKRNPKERRNSWLYTKQDFPGRLRRQLVVYRFSQPSPRDSRLENHVNPSRRGVEW